MPRGHYRRAMLGAVLLSIVAAAPERWVVLYDSASGDLIESIDPATGEVLGEFPAANAQDVDMAVEAVHRIAHS